jgi:hypothetical protein
MGIDSGGAGVDTLNIVAVTISQRVTDVSDPDEWVLARCPACERLIRCGTEGPPAECSAVCRRASAVAARWWASAPMPTRRSYEGFLAGLRRDLREILSGWAEIGCALRVAALARDVFFADPKWRED